MKTKILDQKVGKPEIIGMTTINHAVRVQLGLNCSEYVLMNYIYQCSKNKTPLEVTDTFRRTGFDVEEQKMVAYSLQRKGFILITEDPIPHITSKWASGFADISIEFENEFWKKDGKSIWFTSSKKASFKFYVEARKNYPKEVIIGARNDYLEYLEWEHKRGFDRQIMMAERFLNLKNEYFMTDWKMMSEEIKKKLNPPNVQPKTESQITAEERKKEYDK